MSLCLFIGTHNSWVGSKFQASNATGIIIQMLPQRRPSLWCDYFAHFHQPNWVIRLGPELGSCRRINRNETMAGPGQGSGQPEGLTRYLCVAASRCWLTGLHNTNRRDSFLCIRVRRAGLLFVCRAINKTLPLTLTHSGSELQEW